MRFVWRLAFAAMCVAVLAAWKSPTTLPAPKTPPPATPVYNFVDKRPKDWLKSGPESYQPSNCAYGAFRIGERDITPNPQELLHAMLSERFGDRLAGKTVQLRGFGLHLNQQSRVRQYPLGTLFLDHRACGKEDAFGSYAEDEVPDGTTPIIIAWDLMIDGQRFIGRAIGPSPRNLPIKPNSPQEEQDAWNAAVAPLAEAALKQLGDRIEQGLSAQPAAAVAPPAETQPSPPAGATH